MSSDWAAHAVALADRISHPGSRWHTPLTATPRHRLVPAWWVRDGATWKLQQSAVAEAYADTSLITSVEGLHADHATDGDRPVGLPTSSSTMPSLSIRMYRHGRIDPDSRILEVGTGSGYGLALLAQRYERAESIDVDPYLTAAATRRLAALGLHPVIHTGDATADIPGPFDRIIGTVAVRPIPPAWLDALPYGGRIATTITGTSLILTARRTREGVFGRIEKDMAGFMAARHDGGGYAGTWAVDWDKLTTAEGEHVAPGRYPVIDIREAWDVQGLLEIECPGIAHHYSEQGGQRTAILAHPDGSWARATAHGLDDPLVHQAGPRRLWDELVRVRELWLAHGESPHLGANAMVRDDGTIKLARGTYRATIS